MHMTLQYWDFQTLDITKGLQFYHNIVTAMSSNHSTMGETNMILSPPPSSLLYPKALLVLSIFKHNI